jgi:hypothetical protein
VLQNTAFDISIRRSSREVKTSDSIRLKNDFVDNDDVYFKYAYSETPRAESWSNSEACRK